jgi:hypothetical protein
VLAGALAKSDGTPLARGAIVRGGEVAQNAESGNARLLLVGRPLVAATL